MNRRKSMPRNFNLRVYISLILLLVLTAVAIAQDGTATEVLTNEKVITMVKAGLPPTIIVSKIHASQSNFNTNTDELIRLQQSKVPTEIINAMVEASTHTASSSATKGAGDVLKVDPNDPAAAHEAGIYLYEEKDGKRTMTQLEPTVSKQSKTGGMFSSALTYGIAKIKFKAVLAGAGAALQISNSRPIFYFYFEEKNSGLSRTNYFATSPNEFSLVKMEVKKTGREVIVSQANVFGASSGTLDKYAIDFGYEKIAPGVFKVFPKAELQEGEYGFYFGSSEAGATTAKIFDFGIHRPR
jgi:hypothetical protein